MEMARAAVYEGPNRLVVKELPIPDIGPDDALVEVDIAGVDGTEVHMFRGEVEAINKLAPVLFGDEIVGRVARIGEAASKRRGLVEGDRVVVEARWPCNECRPCRSGNYYLCDRREERGGYGWIRCDAPPYLWGGYSTHVYVPHEAQVFKVPENLPGHTALVASSVLANAIYWTRMSGAGLGDTVAVLGPGPQGIGCAILAARRGADVVIAGLPRDRRRLDLAERLSGAKAVVLAEDASQAGHRAALRDAFGGREVSVVIETAGVQASKDLAAKLVRTDGRIVCCSIPARPLTVDFTGLLLNQISLISPFGHPDTVGQSLDLGARLLQDGRDIGDMITHVFPLDEAELAVRTAGYETTETPIKVVIRPNG